MPTGAYFYSIWFAQNSSHPYWAFRNSHPTAFELGNYVLSYQQQGLTANVTCTMDQSSPLAFTINQTLSTVSQSNSSLNLISPTITCDGVNAIQLPPQLVGTDFVLASYCSYPNQTQHVRGPKLPYQTLELITRSCPHCRYICKDTAHMSLTLKMAAPSSRT
jgi:hypothetical protein